MTLNEINQTYRSDKGFGHNYLDFYENLFSTKRYDKLNILEIGVLFGNSLKLWNDYFINSMIYGMDNFSQENGHSFYDGKPVIADEIISDLSKYERIKLFVIDCENETLINETLSHLKFDIIIDDASHDLHQQINNYKIFNKFLKLDGIFVCEDVQTDYYAKDLMKYITNTTPHKIVEQHDFNINERTDDRLLIVK